MKSINSHADRWPGLLWVTLLLAAIAFFSALGRRDIVTSHEARVIQTARQMAASGWPWNATPVKVPQVEVVTIDGMKSLNPSKDGKRMLVNPWIAPVLNGEIRLKKPPLPYWCDAVLFRLFDFSEAVARFPTALLGFLGSILIFDLARTLIGRRAALPAMIIWITTHFIVDEYRKTMADPYLAFATLMTLWAWARASRARNRGRFIVLFYIALAIGALAKGPVILAFVIPALVVWRITMWHSRPRLCSANLQKRIHSRGGLCHIIGLAVFGLLVLPWLFLVIRALPQATDIWRYELEASEKPREAYYYLLTIAQLTLLWTIPWLVGIGLTLIHGRRGWRSPRGRVRVFALAWMVIVLIIFSLKEVKKNAYLLPIMPACVLLAADGIAVILFAARRKSGEALASIAMIAQAIIGIGFALSVMVLMIRNHRGASAVAVTGVILLIAGLPLWAVLRKQSARWLYLQAVAYVAVLVAFIGLHMSSLDAARSPRAFAEALLQVSQETKLPIWRAKSPEEVSVYLPIDLPDAAHARRVLIAVDDPKGQFLPTPKAMELVTDGVKVIDLHEAHLPLEATKHRYRLFDVTLDRGPNQLARRAGRSSIMASNRLEVPSS